DAPAGCWSTTPRRAGNRMPRSQGPPSRGGSGRPSRRPNRRDVRKSRTNLERGQNRDANLICAMSGTTFRTAPVRARETAVFRDSILAKLTYACGKDRADAQPRDWFVATAHALRDRVVDRWMAGERGPAAPGKRVYLLSVEYLIGRLLGDALCNLA